MSEVVLLSEGEGDEQSVEAKIFFAGYGLASANNMPVRSCGLRNFLIYWHHSHRYTIHFNCAAYVSIHILLRRVAVKAGSSCHNDDHATARKSTDV